GYGPASGAACVHEVRAVRLDPHHGLAQRPRGARDLLGRLALHAQADEQGGELHRGRLPPHHRPEHVGGLLLAQRLAVGEGGDRAVQRRGCGLRRRGHRGARGFGPAKLPRKIAFCQMPQRVAWLDWPFVSPYLSAVTSRPYLAVAQYDGAQFAGWQRQPDGRTVQAEFEAVLEKLMGRRTPATGAGRTDTGVHALGQGVGFLAGERWAADTAGLLRALNALLPRDIWVERLHAMRPGFHARNSAQARRYRYVIGTDQAARSPFRRPYEWALGCPLEVTLLGRAAEDLVGGDGVGGLGSTGARLARPHYRTSQAHQLGGPGGLDQRDHDEPVLARQTGRRPGPAGRPERDLLARRGSRVRRSRRGRHRRDAARGQAAGQDRRQHRRQDPDARGGDGGGAAARRRRDQDQRHAL